MCVCVYIHIYMCVYMCVYDRWKVLDKEFFFILRNSLKGSIRMKLHSFTKIIHAVCLDHFGAADV